ncbi:MAG TPA: ABC transporter permease [Pyrinomonadaceae bacterium]|jgi:putative ABC transport system permease protein|nr:ABC transporter permease [Pyrinomonadaceae bacterium]
METLLKDFRYGVRSLLKRPGFTAIAVVTLALGIGANTAIFSLVNAVLLRSLPFADPDRLVMIWEDASFAGFPRNTPAPANYLDWKTQNTVFADMAAQDMRSFNLTGDGEPEKIEAFGVSANFFPLLGVQPALGRGFTADEDAPGAARVVVINHNLWQQRYGGEQNIIGRQLLLNGEKYAVVGVMPAGFQFLDSKVGLWVPIGFTSEQLTQRNSHYLSVVARMKPGVTFAQANAEIQTIQQRISRDHPDEAGRINAYARPLRDEVAGDVQRPLMVLLVAVAFVLLIACANIANLLLSRAASRAREMAVRAALGAGRLRIVRQLLVEGLLMSAAGALGGLVLAWWSFAFLQRLVPDGLALSTTLHLDPKVLGFTLLVALLTTVLFGLVPAFQATKIDLNLALKQGGGRSGLNAGGNRLRSAMVVAEVALALVLLVGAGLLIQTFLKLRDQYASLNSENVLTLRTVLPTSKYAEAGLRANFYKQVLERVRSLPGVVSAGYTTSIPLAWKGGTSGFIPEGRSVEQITSGGVSYDANHRQVSADYLKTMGIPLLRGRSFSDADNQQSTRVAIINETMARQYWPGEDPLGKRFTMDDPDEKATWVTVVGVAGDVRQMGVDEPVKAEMYFPYQQGQMPFYAPRDLSVRTSVDPLSIVAAVRNEVHQVDPEQPISNVRSMDAMLGEETASRRLGMTLLTIFAGLALLLATLGIYGVLAYFVVQHTQEIGVRMALGAQRGNILRLVLKKGMTLALLGVVIGLGIALGLTRLMTSLLYGVSATDPLTYVVIASILTTVAFLACYLPARRATKVDPMVALTYE